jgi:hypothetical protein
MVFRIEGGKNFSDSQTQTVWQTIARKKLSARICQTVLGQFFKIFADTLEKWWGLAPPIPSHIESTARYPKGIRDSPSRYPQKGPAQIPRYVQTDPG